MEMSISSAQGSWPVYISWAPVNGSSGMETSKVEAGMTTSTCTPTMMEGTVVHMKRKLVTAAENDLPWRKFYCYMQRAGVTAGIKRQIRRRERREGKKEMIKAM